MGFEARKHCYQVPLSHLDKFFRYGISGNFEREKKKHLKGIFLLTHLDPAPIPGQSWVFCFFNQSPVVFAQVHLQRTKLELIGTGFKGHLGFS